MKRLPTIDLIMELSARESIASEYECIEPPHLLIAVLKISQIDADLVKGKLEDRHLMSLLLDELEEVQTILKKNGTAPAEIARQVRDAIGRGGSPFKGGTIHRSADSKAIFEAATNLAIEKGATFLNTAHLLQALLEREPAYGLSIPNTVSKENHTADSISLNFGECVEVEEVEEQPVGADPVDLVETAQRLRRELRKSVFGQDQVLTAFLDSLLSSEILAGVEPERKSPKAAFLFAGPPGVGKTHLARCVARILRKPFKRIDMSSLKDPQDAGLIVGVHRSVGGFQPGILTDFVARNPDCLILVRRIEDAHPSAVRLLGQVLEDGELKDQFTEQTVSFSRAVIIFTTSAGKALYETAGSTAASKMETHYHKAMLMDLLKKEQDPATGKPVLPGTLFSRGVNVVPVIFAPLGVNAFIHVAEAEMNRMGVLLEKQYEKKIEYEPDVPLCLVLRQGLGTNAGVLRSEVETFVMTEILNFFKMCKSERLKKLMRSTERILFQLDADASCPDEVVSLLTTPNPRVLLLADSEIEALWPESIPGVDWMLRCNGSGIGSLLRESEIDLVLMDLMLGAGDTSASSDAPGGLTMVQFDYVPWGASGVAFGRQLLSTVHDTRPDLPCYLISYTNRDHGPKRPTVDNELLSACIQSGQVQGVVETGFVSTSSNAAEMERDELNRRIRELARGIYLERTMRHGDYRGKVLSFETVPSVSHEQKTIRIRLRNLRLFPVSPALDPSRREGPMQGQQVPGAAGQAPSEASTGLPAAPLVEPARAKTPAEEHVVAHGGEVRQEPSEPGTVSDNTAIGASPSPSMDDAEDSLEFRDTLLEHYLEEDSQEREFVIDDGADANAVKPASETPEESKKESQPSAADSSDSDTDEFTWD